MERGRREGQIESLAVCASACGFETCLPLVTAPGQGFLRRRMQTRSSHSMPMMEFIILIRGDSTQHPLDCLRHLNPILVIFTRFRPWVMCFQEYSNSQEILTQAGGILADNSELSVRISRRPDKREHRRSRAAGRADWVVKRCPVAFHVSRGCIKLAAGA